MTLPWAEPPGRLRPQYPRGSFAGLGEVEVTDYPLFSHEDVAGRDAGIGLPARDGSRQVTNLFRGLEFRAGRTIGDLDGFLTRTAAAAFIVVVGDTVIYERYFNGYGRDSIMTSFSVAKSFVSTIVGAAVGKGLIGSVHDPVKAGSTRGPLTMPGSSADSARRRAGCAEPRLSDPPAGRWRIRRTLPASPPA